MDEIPEDILDVARRVVRSLGDADHDSGENAEAIARAILLERERCAIVALTTHAKTTSGDEHAPVIKASTRAAAKFIAGAIRKGLTP